MTAVTEDIRVRRVIRLIEDQVADPLSIAELARAVNLSPGHLRRLFHSVVGCSPAHYARQHRLRHAFELLQSSFLSIKEIMAAAGWNDPSHFCREFKRQYGVSPRSLRTAPQSGATDDLMSGTANIS
jgi:transcriptional regulator GlxA family with amidase domain